MRSVRIAWWWKRRTGDSGRDRLNVTLNNNPGRRLDPLPEQYWATGDTSEQRCCDEHESQVTNPFYIGNFESIRTSDPVLYQHMSTLSQFNTTTIAKNRLLRPFPHMNGLINTADNSGTMRTHALEVNFQRGFSRGFNFNASYTYMVQEESYDPGK